MIRCWPTGQFVTTLQCTDIRFRSWFYHFPSDRSLKCINMHGQPWQGLRKSSFSLPWLLELRKAHSWRWCRPVFGAYFAHFLWSRLWHTFLVLRRIPCGKVSAVCFIEVFVRYNIILSWAGNLHQIFNRRGWDFHRELVEKYGTVVTVHALFGVGPFFHRTPFLRLTMAFRTSHTFLETERGIICYGSTCIAPHYGQGPMCVRTVAPFHSVSARLMPYRYDTINFDSSQRE